MSAQLRGSNLSNRTLNGLANVNSLAKYSKLGGAASFITGGVIGVYNIKQAYQLDGGNIGYNTVVTSTKTLGSMAGGWAGAEAGASVGAAIGVWFGGVGAVPGAIIGGIIGGVAGGIIGEEIGESFGQQIAK